MSDLARFAASSATLEPFACPVPSCAGEDFALIQVRGVGAELGRIHVKCVLCHHVLMEINDPDIVPDSCKRRIVLVNPLPPECGMCAGSGWVHDRPPVRALGVVVRYPHKSVCPDCQGRGWCVALA